MINRHVCNPADLLEVMSIILGDERAHEALDRKNKRDSGIADEVRMHHATAMDTSLGVEERLYALGMVLVLEVAVPGCTDVVPDDLRGTTFDCSEIYATEYKMFLGQLIRSDHSYVKEVMERNRCEMLKQMLELFHKGWEFDDFFQNPATIALQDMERYVLLTQAAEACGVTLLIPDETHQEMKEFQLWLKDYGWAVAPALWARFSVYYAQDPTVNEEFMPWAHKEMSGNAAFRCRDRDYIGAFLMTAEMMDRYPTFKEFLDYLKDM